MSAPVLQPSRPCSVRGCQNKALRVCSEHHYLYPVCRQHRVAAQDLSPAVDLYCLDHWEIVRAAPDHYGPRQQVEDPYE
jgi:hypothetical protein